MHTPQLLQSTGERPEDVVVFMQYVLCGVHCASHIDAVAAMADSDQGETFAP